MPVKSTKNKVENVKKNFAEHEMGYDIVKILKRLKKISPCLKCVIYPKKKKSC